MGDQSIPVAGQNLFLLCIRGVHNTVYCFLRPLIFFLAQDFSRKNCVKILTQQATPKLGVLVAQLDSKT
jgi:hypothetical protein